jgi:hypothetical protein
MRSLRLTTLSCLALASCGGTVQLDSNTVITINSPADGATVFALTPLAFNVTATNPAGVSAVVLQVGESGAVVVQTCPATTSSTSITCEVTLDVTTLEGQLQNNILHLQAIATDAKQLKKNSSVDVTVTHVQLAFTQPAASGSPPVADVQGTSELVISAQDDIAITSIQVTYGGTSPSTGLPLTEFHSAPYQESIDWPLELQGVGPFELFAVATDAQGRTATASLSIVVLCAQDADCPMANQRCCSDGTCQDDSAMPACQ